VNHRTETSTVLAAAEPFLITANISLPLLQSQPPALFFTAVLDVNGNVLEPETEISLHRPDLAAFFMARSTVRRILVSFFLYEDYYMLQVRNDFQACLRKLVVLAPSFEFGFQVWFADELDENTPAGRASVRSSVRGWFVDYALGAFGSSLRVLTEGSTAVVRLDAGGTWRQGNEFFLVKFWQP